MRHAALLAVHYNARLLASTASLGTRVTASAEVGALGSRGEEHRTLPGDKAFAAARHAGQDIYVSSHGSFTQSFTILDTNYFIYFASCLVSHALPSCALACGCYRPRDHECANITCILLRTRGIARHPSASLGTSGTSRHITACRSRSMHAALEA